ncbi:hypothetical protein HWI77_07965 [Acinetobacter venetianus]|nr:hypothetical protein HWI77_07965 [Acinetobacter venetianus]
MSDKHKLVDVNKGYRPTATPKTTEGNITLGYQPAKATGDNPTNSPTKTSSPPKKP